MIRKISLRRFNAFCYVRLPFLLYSFKELAWYEAFNVKLLGTVVIDTDGEYLYMILARDKRKIFRAWDFANHTFETQDEAEEALIEAFAKYENDGQEVYEQGDEKMLPHEFLQPQVPADKLHPYFKSLLEQRGHEGARNMINEIVYSFMDVDGNYIKDFQTTGFDARLWELYLYVYLYSAGFDFDKSKSAPDYLVSYYGEDFAIEAVTVNKSTQFDEPNPQNMTDAFLLSRDYMPIKYGSSLISKLRKKYWLKNHVSGKPFIIAIHDFHQASTPEKLGSMTWSRNALIDYLFGVRPKYTLDENGEVVLGVRQTKHGVSQDYESVHWHEWKGKKIESGFFLLPDAENVSVVLFSNSATLTTFNRMGQLAGLGRADTQMIRFMDVYNPDPNSITPIRMAKNIADEDYEEAWGDGLVMYHNPDAKYPVDPDCFPDIAHIFYDKKQMLVYGIPHPFSVLNSLTMVLIPQSEDETKFFDNSSPE